MKIVCIGGGPANLYFSILMKKAHPDARIEVIERNRHDDTFGWGVVFSDETLDGFAEADSESFAEITANFKRWQNIETYFGDSCTVSTGHGFSALSRKRLLLILQERCRALGVQLEFEREISDFAEFDDADLIVGGDGVNSFVRETYARFFQPEVDWRRCKFCWLGTDKPLNAFTFIFKETPFGLFQIHAYPFEDGLATWIVECREEVWQAAGLDQVDEAGTVQFCRDLCSEELEGYQLFTNRSLWRTFPTIRCNSWHHENTVLLGDAAHTAHFSIGSGTKLAMEDAMVLVSTLIKSGLDDIPAALAAYEDDRWVDVIKTQKAAQTSLEWFENSARYLEQSPIEFTFNLMTRSKRITYDNLRERDPQLIAKVNDAYQESAGLAETTDTKAPPPLFTGFRLRALELSNRIVVSPMCQYSAVDGVPNDWHLVHLGSRAIGGAGLLMTEMTDVAPGGRITPRCTGMYTPEHAVAWGNIVKFVHEHSNSKIGVQLAHAGRKGSVVHPWEGPDKPLAAAEGGWETIAPSALPFYPDWQIPKEMGRAEMDQVIAAFERSTRWSQEAAFDLLELHMAHGYLLSSFLSPLSNQRSDDYGGSLKNRMRFPLEVFEAVRSVWPDDKPTAVRISASDWMDGDAGVTIEESVELARALKARGCDLIDVSSAGNSPASAPEYGRMYQVPFAEQIRYEAGIPVAAVGAILGDDHANTILASGRADLAVMARPHLHNPYLTLHAAEKYQQWEHPWPNQYLPARPQPPRSNKRRK